MGFPKIIGTGLFTLGLALGAAGCSVSVDDVHVNTGGPDAKEVAAKFPNLTKAEFSKANPALGEDFTLTLTASGAATIANPFLTSATDSTGVGLSSPTNDNVFTINPLVKAQQAAEGKFTATFLLKAAPKDGYTAESYYMYEKTKSETNYIVSYSCTNDAHTDNDLNKCFPELGLSEAKKGEINAGLTSMTSEIALPWVEVGPSAVDFAVSVTDVNTVDATHIAVYFSVTNNGTVDAVVNVGIFPGMVPSVSTSMPSLEYLLSVPAGATVNEAKPVSFNWVSSSSYSTGVWVDQPDGALRGEFFESNEADNIGGFDWTAP